MSMNMSYCRFNNTVLAMKECMEALQSVEAGEEVLSKDELRSAVEFAKLCSEVVMTISEHAAIEGEDLYDALSDYHGKLEDTIQSVLGSMNDEAKETLGEDE